MNDPGKLFRVLVLGGAFLGAGCTNSERPAPSATDGATSADDGGGARELCFCPGDDGVCCETNASGASVPRAGIECCWSTSC